MSTDPSGLSAANMSDLKRAHSPDANGSAGALVKKQRTEDDGALTTSTKPAKAVGKRASSTCLTACHTTGSETPPTKPWLLPQRCSPACECSIGGGCDQQCSLVYLWMSGTSESMHTRCRLIWRTGAAQGPQRTSGLLAPIMLLTGHAGEVLTVKFNPAGDVVASGSGDKHVFLWRTYGECENFMMIKGDSCLLGSFAAVAAVPHHCMQSLETSSAMLGYA